MYEYLKKRHIPAALSMEQSLGFGALGDRYIPARPTSRIAPWAAVETTVQNIRVKCYQNAPREEVLREMVPYTMEISVPGNNFICLGNPIQECPESVHRGTDPKDPWRQRQCAAWRQTWERQAADIIASQDFRNQVTENVLNIAGISAWQRVLAKPAEFLQVVEERERRERSIKILSVLAFAAGGGVILWTYLRSRKEKAQDLEQNPAARSYRTVHEPPIEYGDGDNPPGREDRPFIKKIIDEMVKSAAREGLGAHHVQWIRSGARYRIGNSGYIGFQGKRFHKPRTDMFQPVKAKQHRNGEGFWQRTQYFCNHLETSC